MPKEGVKCPRDGAKCSLRKMKSSILSFEVDECSKCGGFFLDRGEVAKLAGGRELERLLHEYAGERGPLGCPRCGQGMKLRTLRAEGNEVTLDLCPGCRGVWLDGGELEALRAAYRAYRGATPAAPRAERAGTVASIARAERTAAVRDPDPILFAHVLNKGLRPP